jgi:hypothetical protein
MRANVLFYWYIHIHDPASDALSDNNQAFSSKIYNPQIRADPSPQAQPNSKYSTQSSSPSAQASPHAASPYTPTHHASHYPSKSHSHPQAERSPHPIPPPQPHSPETDTRPPSQAHIVNPSSTPPTSRTPPHTTQTGSNILPTLWCTKSPTKSGRISNAGTGGKTTAPACLALIILCKWMVLSGASRAANTSLLRSLSTTSAAHEIKSSQVPRSNLCECLHATG